MILNKNLQLTYKSQYHEKEMKCYVIKTGPDFLSMIKLLLLLLYFIFRRFNENLRQTFN